jgi:hypothetical protein
VRRDLAGSGGACNPDFAAFLQDFDAMRGGPALAVTRLCGRAQVQWSWQAAAKRLTLGRSSCEMVDFMLLRPALVCVLLCLPLSAGEALWAETPVQSAVVADFAESLRIDEVLAVMQAEGLDSGADLAVDMFGAPGGAEWQATLTRIYDPAAMRARFDLALAEAAGAESETLAASLAFFGSELGQRIVGLEIEARRALLDPAAEDAANAAWATLQDQDAQRVTQLEQFAQVNDLIESNVMGALNANLAYYRAMSNAGAFGDKVPEDQMLAEVWAQEADLRSETVDWLFPYLVLAYNPLSTDDLQAYLDFSASPAGRRANGMIFAAFDAVFVAISVDLGRAVALQMTGRDI